MAEDGHTQRVARGVLLACTAVLLVSALGQRDWVWAGLCAAVVALLATSGRREQAAAGRRTASAAAAAAWTPERVAEVVAQAGGDRTAAVQALRRADPALTLDDALALVPATPDADPPAT
jgi:hypothetical protein